MALPSTDPGGGGQPAPKPTAPAKAPGKTPAQVAAEKAKAAAAAAAKKKAADAAAKAKAAAAKAAAAAEAKAKKDAATSAAETAASFGWSIEFFKSIPELKTLLDQATSGQWTPARFTAALQGTSWFRKTTESSRKYQTLRATDPASFQQQINEGTFRVQNLAAQMGAAINGSQARGIADLALKNGWGEDHLKRFLSYQTKPQKDGNYVGGQAAAAQSQYRALAEEYGINVSDSLVQHWVQSTLIGGDTPESVKARIQASAASKYVALAERIKGGETVRQIADPYMQSYGKLLEINGQNISIDDPLIQRALQSKDAKGKPTTQTVYDFENTLRNDPRWAKTDNARNQMSATANSILSTFGLA